jgi:hypothetical protein
MLPLSENNVNNNRVMLLLKISILSESGAFENIFPNSFIARPNSIKKAMLKPTEKTILSNISKFFNAKILRIIIPGTKSRYAKQITIRAIVTFAHTTKFTITSKIRNKIMELFNFGVRLFCKIHSLGRSSSCFYFNAKR